MRGSEQRALTYYTVDPTPQAHPVHVLAPGRKSVDLFTGPFDSPEAAREAFCMYWGEKGAARALDAAAFCTQCEGLGIASYHVSYLLLVSSPGQAVYASDRQGQTRRWPTEAEAIAEVLCLRLSTPNQTYDVLEEMTLGRTHAMRCVCTFPGEDPAVNERLYLADVLRSCSIPSRDQRERLCLGALGLSGEAGEVADLVKKHLYQGHGVDRRKLLNELGDVLWSLMLLCHILDVSLEEVMRDNSEKVRERYPHGCEAACSLQREETNR